MVPHAWGSDILTAATLHFVASLPEETFLEFNTSQDPLSRELVTQPFELVDGCVPVSFERGSWPSPWLTRALRPSNPLRRSAGAA